MFFDYDANYKLLYYKNNEVMDDYQVRYIYHGERKWNICEIMDEVVLAAKQLVVTRKLLT